MNMTNRPDFYAILQVHPQAEPEVIDAAYRRLAAKYHPDVNRDSMAAERMKQINAAYEVLSDPAKRRSYDAGRGQNSRVPRPTAQGIWRSLAIPLALAALLYFSSRMGPGPSLIFAGLLLLAILYFTSAGRGRRG